MKPFFSNSKRLFKNQGIEAKSHMIAADSSIYTQAIYVLLEANYFSLIIFRVVYREVCILSAI